MRISDWSSDVCSSDLVLRKLELAAVHGLRAEVVERRRVAGAQVEDALPGRGGGLVLPAHGQLVRLGHQAGNSIGRRLVHDGIVAGAGMVAPTIRIRSSRRLKGWE